MCRSKGSSKNQNSIIWLTTSHGLVTKKDWQAAGQLLLHHNWIDTLMQEFSKQKKVQTLESHQHFSFLSFPKTNKNTNNLPSFFFVYFLFISVHHYLLATMHFMCKQRRATTIFLISIDAQLLGKERTNGRFSGMITDYGVRTSFWLPAGCFIMIALYGLRCYLAHDKSLSDAAA